MRRSALRTTAARAIVSQSRRSLIQSSPRCHPDLAYSTASDAEASVPPSQKERRPFRFETGLALFAKRPPRPFPPPFLSPPSGSFSDPLSTHNRSRDRRAFVNGELIKGYTNGDDAVYDSDMFIGANDGVGAWSTRPGGHAGLWSRLILHFWAMEMENDAERARPTGEQYIPNPVLVLRPRDSELVYKTKEQWHWFDCPRQLGTNSPDTPRDNAVMDKVPIEENDVVLAMSDGVIDNLWEHEIIDNVVSSIRRWESGQGGEATGDRHGGAGGGMKFVAEELMKAAKVIATDPFAESPFMEHAVEEGLAMEGGKRSKQYCKLMQQYGLTFGFREPYQVLGRLSHHDRNQDHRLTIATVDADIIRDADRFKMDLIGGLERTLHGQVKPMITQCSMRHLYALSTSPNPEPGINYLIDKAKTFERRRCNHLPEDYPVPLSAEVCISSVVDPKDSKTNKHRYVVASQDLEVRKAMRNILGVPLVYISRSVMIMEPMADQSRGQREKGERVKFRDGIKRGGGKTGEKRKRDDEETEGDGGEGEKKKIKRKGPKGPNPLSVKKPKKRVPEGEDTTVMEKKVNKEKKELEREVATRSQLEGDGSDPAVKKKRKRKHKAAVGEGAIVAEAAGDGDD
ncbi:rRNA-processing utp23 [Hyphodiscus hymeniophilus]|uniref:rRNA-processing utp23 n=1 Tax=Hyphodiscus hymeniophilus TaxID=353542 RepID=A0A9P6VNJ5_9HELO|nr:rRNA-processing utp23 [Hyphodiscus hymeniophilus]